MAELYKSEEIYRKVSVPDGDDKLVPIQGLYVVGEYTTPDYHNPTILITDITASSADVADYTDKYVTDTGAEGILAIVDVQINPNYQYQPYSREYEDIELEGIMAIVDLQINPNYQYEEYSRQYTDQNNEGIMTILELSSTYNVSYQDILTGLYESQPDQMLVITDISVSNLTVYE